MKTRKFLYALSLATFVAALMPTAMLANPLYKVTNVSPFPSLTNEFYLTATNITTSINGTNVKVMVYVDDPPGGGGVPKQIPGPLIEANVGQTIICHFKNLLTNNSEGATVHWHGIELDNDSDGTAVTQDTVLKGQTYTYRFVMSRPGVYWYHSHMTPGTTTFAGMYGPIIVHDSHETTLVGLNVLAATNHTFQLLLSDTSFTNGAVGKVFNGTNYSLNSLIQMCENNILGNPGGDRGACSAGTQAGAVPLCNGSVASRAGTLCAPTTNSAPVFYIGKNRRVRLQIINASISRNAYLSLKFPCSNPTGDTNLYHIGGQGGLLDSAVLDGGVQSGYDFQYTKGTVNLGSGMREDVMFYSSGNAGDVIQLVGNDPGGHWQLGSGLAANYPVAFFVVTNSASTDSPLAVGTPILSAIGAANENLRLLNTNALVPPPLFGYGTQNGLITFSNSLVINGVSNGPSIGGYAATELDGNSGFGSWPLVHHPPTALWAQSGSVLQLAIANDSGGSQTVHPFHLHGFSMQPVAIYTADLQTNLFTYPYNQFVDTMDIMPGQALVFRIKLTDRSVIADAATGGPVTTSSDAPSGGNLGRWLMHCHIFLHGAVGMISELVVVPGKNKYLVSQAASTNTLLFTGGNVPWNAVTNATWLHVASNYVSGTGNRLIPFTVDANNGATRTATLDVNGLTAEVTQAGISYVQAPGPLTNLVSGSITNPFGIAVGDNGDVFFNDSGSGAMKRWNRSNNTVSTLISGLSTPYGLGLDGLGNVYSAQFTSTAVKMWSATTHATSTLFNNDTTGVAGLAVDNSGNVLIAVPAQHKIKSWSPATGTLSSYTTNGLISPWGVAVDSLGGVYCSDLGDNTMKKFYFLIVPPFIILTGWSPVITNLNSPYDLTVDYAGNVFVGDYNNHVVKKWSAASNTVSTVVSNGLSLPIGVAVDNIGNLFIADWGNDAIKEQPYAFVDPTPQFEPADLTVDQLSPVLLPEENLLPPFAPKPNAPWIFYGGATAGVPKILVTENTGPQRTGTITVLGTNITIVQAGSYFALGTTNLLVGPLAGSGTITVGLSPATSNWLATTATPWLHLPSAAGTGSTNVLFNYDLNFGATRSGSITINSRTVSVTQAGISYVAAPPPATTILTNGLASPVDVEPDKLGNLFISDSGNNTVKRLTPAGTTSTLMSGFTPQSLDVDDSGNVYVADFFNNAVKEWHAADSSVTTLFTTPSAPSGVSLDYYNNVHVSRPGIFNHSIMKWISAISNVVTVVDTNMTSPYGISVDVAGNIFIADAGNNTIKEWDASADTLSLFAGGFGVLNSPWDCAVDGSGNVYVADGNNNRIAQWNAASASVVSLVPGGLSNPVGVGVDQNQNLFIADFGNSAIKELPHAFVDAAQRNEPFTGGSDALLPVLPAGQSLAGPFAPSVGAPWLSITNVANSVITFKFAANTNSAARSSYITVLGQNVFVVQDGQPPVPVFTGISTLTNGVFQLSFTNGIRGGVYSVLFSTNLLVPLTNWPVIGTATNNGLGVWQFTDFGASNQTRFYRIRSP